MGLSALTKERVRTYVPLLSRMQSRSSLSSGSTLFQDPPFVYDSQAYNIILFGESGAGKSSVVNLIAGGPVARTSPDAGACTFASEAYHIDLGGHKPYRVWDTIGLNEPDISRKDYLRSIKHAYKLINDLERSGGINLLLLCMRGRITSSVQQNYKLFVKVLCEKKVPLGVVVTNLENEACMEGWWTENKEAFKKYEMSVDGHACITTISGFDEAFKERKEESRESMHKLLLGLTVPATSGGWKKENVRAWFTDLLAKMMKMLPRRSVHPTEKELVDKLTRGCGFSKDDANDIAKAIMKIRESLGCGDEDSR